jgi:hypothetical protein
MCGPRAWQGQRPDNPSGWKGWWKPCRGWHDKSQCRDAEPRVDFPPGFFAHWSSSGIRIGWNQVRSWCPASPSLGASLDEIHDRERGQLESKLSDLIFASSWKLDFLLLRRLDLGSRSSHQAVIREYPPTGMVEVGNWTASGIRSGMWTYGAMDAVTHLLVEGQWADPPWSDLGPVPLLSCQTRLQLSTRATVVRATLTAWWRGSTGYFSPDNRLFSARTPQSFFNYCTYSSFPCGKPIGNLWSSDEICSGLAAAGDLGNIIGSGSTTERCTTSR